MLYNYWIFIFFPILQIKLFRINAQTVLIHTFKLQRCFFRQLVWKIYCMRLFHFGIKWKLLICKGIKLSFCNLYFDVLFWILKLFNFNFLYWVPTIVAFCYPLPHQFRSAVHYNVIGRSFKRKMCLSHYVIDKNYFNNLKK